MARPILRSITATTTPRHELYRLKAVASELRAKDARDPAVRQDWEEMAIEWHLMANLAARSEQPRPAEPHDIGHYLDNLSGAMLRVVHGN